MPAFYLSNREKKNTNIVVMMCNMQRGFYLIDRVKKKNENYSAMPMNMMAPKLAASVIEEKKE